MSIDLEFRPESYADFDDPIDLAVNGIKGQLRREMVRDMLSAEGEYREVVDRVLGPIEQEILEEKAPEGFTGDLTRVHGPQWMGGEYLPDHLLREVEIARIVLQSSTMDVFSVRARPVRDGYRYRIVDEYDSEFRVEPEHSKRPLTLGQLIHMLETAESSGLSNGGAGLVECWWWQQWEFGYPAGECTSFASVESEQYPGLAEVYAERAVEWEAARRAEDPSRETDR